jgi:hypothetical protein
VGIGITVALAGVLAGGGAQALNGEVRGAPERI